jgi:hypothetical protein
MMGSTGKAGRNEQRKLRANTFNAIGIAFGAVGFVQPIVIGEMTVEAAIKVVLSGLIGYVLHRQALRLLATLED